VIYLKDQTVVEESVEETTSQDSSPQSKEVITEPQNTQETQVGPEQITEEVLEDAGVEKTMSEEQRKAFQEMRLENKKYKEELDKRQKGESAFDIFRPKVSNVGVDLNSYVDPVSGNVNWPAYNQAVTQQATAHAQHAVKEQLDEDRARSIYPDVFANPKLENAIAGEWFAQKLQGKDVSVSEIAAGYADLVKQSVAKAEKQAEKRGAEQALNELTVKEAASLGVKGTTSAPARQATSAEEEARLSEKARFGDDDALAKLVGNVGWKK
jgi:hypothetical protein